MPKYESILLSDYIPSGEGGTAVSYKHKSQNTLAKLYNPGFEAERAIAEYLTAQTVYEMGISTPKPIRLVTDGERYGAEYEFIPGKRSFARIISQEPERLEEITLEFARQASQLHGMKADPTRLRSYREVMKQFYLEKDMVPEEYKQRALAFLEKVPDAPSVLHGDLQIGNIITDGNGIWWIDVGEFAYGVPEWDLSLMWTMCNNMDDKRAEFLFHVSHETLAAHWKLFLPAYLGTSDPQDLGAYTRRILPYYAVKVPYILDMAEHRRLPDPAFEKLIQLM